MYQQQQQQQQLKHTATHSIGNVSVYRHFVRESRHFLKHIKMNSCDRVADSCKPFNTDLFHQIDETENYFQSISSFSQHQFRNISIWLDMRMKSLLFFSTSCVQNEAMWLERVLQNLSPMSAFEYFFPCITSYFGNFN